MVVVVVVVVVVFVGGDVVVVVVEVVVHSPQVNGHLACTVNLKGGGQLHIETSSEHPALGSS